MALSATSSYVAISQHDPKFLDLLRTFWGENDVNELAGKVFSFLKNSYTNISGKFSLGDYSCSTWYGGSAEALTAWPDSEGWGRHLLANYIASEKVLAHMHYPLASEIKSAVATPDSVFKDKLSRVGKTVTDISEFPYKVTRQDAKVCAASFGKPGVYTEDLIFCIGNYLGRLPVKEEVFGEKILPIAAVRAGTLVLDVDENTLSNERRLAVLNLRGKNKMGDPVEGVYFKTKALDIRAVATFVFNSECIDLVVGLPAVQYTILNCLRAYPVVAETFEDRVDGLVHVQARVRKELEGLLPFKKEVDLDVVLREATLLPGEIFRGDAATIYPRFKRNVTGGVLLRVGSRFSVEEYSCLTRRLVAALLNRNLSLSVGYTEAILMILQRYIHYRTNALRFVNLPNMLQFYKGSDLLTVNFEGVDEVFSTYQHTIPEIERAWCAPLADVAYMFLKDTGGSFAKWKDLPDIPSHMNFDFVGYVDPKLLSNPELSSLTSLMERFRSKKTPVRGFQLGGRASNPIDHMVDNLNLSELESSSVKKLVSNKFKGRI
uniref:60kDa protein n=1 Tax=Grapevine leafroll-associated virus 4 TaxID=70177 RepID=I7HBN2_9CLOS|nr:60kDa protein [Grapevine leafroll-associated virus 4]